VADEGRERETEEEEKEDEGREREERAAEKGRWGVVEVTGREQG
jgi:hypothetical protein